MPSRASASIGYAGGAVDVEIDVFNVTDKEYDADTGRWRDSKGQFTTAPDIDTADIISEANRIQSIAADNMRSPELARQIRSAQMSIEDWETTGERPTGDTRNVVRIDPQGNGDFIRYVVRGGELHRL